MNALRSQFQQTPKHAQVFDEFDQRATKLFNHTKFVDAQVARIVNTVDKSLKDTRFDSINSLVGGLEQCQALEFDLEALAKLNDNAKHTEAQLAKFATSCTQFEKSFAGTQNSESERLDSVRAQLRRELDDEKLGIDQAQQPEFDALRSKYAHLAQATK